MGLLEEYFINPVVYETGKYNIVNTLAYGLILVASAYLVFEVLKRLKIKIDRNFACALLPFIALGAGLRVLRDAEVLKSDIFITPGSYFVTFTIAFSALLLSIAAQRRFKIKYWKIMLATGVLLCAPVYLLLISMTTNATALAEIILISIAWYVALTTVSKTAPQLLTKQNIMIISVHMLDASSTFVGKYLGFVEEHVVAGALIPLFGPWIMFPLKLAIVVPVLYFFDRDIKDRNYRNWWKILVLILGLAPGIRNTMGIAAMV
ncbi:MAG: DUF63 family protein [Candidatus Aenigmatarchaeota archaeon]